MLGIAAAQPNYHTDADFLIDELHLAIFNAFKETGKPGMK
jgi:hypothetical protein